MGKGGNALNVWLKEFCALVFTQTIQAFIYAIIITLILFGMVSTSGMSVSGTDRNASLGLMSTFALLSVFKVEEMAKKIFGVGDTKANHRNAMQSLMKTAFAVKLGKRVLNNVGKVTGGIRAINDSRQNNRKVKSRLEEDMQDNGFVMGADGKPVYVGKKRTAQAGSSSAVASIANTSSASRSSAEVNEDVEVSVGGNLSVASGGYDLSAADNRRMKNALRNYEDQLSDIKKARREGIKSIAAGITETIGAGIGATTGGLIGVADGDLDGLFNGLVAGAGAGDAIGEATVNTIDKATKFVQRNYNRKAGISSKKLQSSIDSYKSALANANVYHGSTRVDDIDI